MTIGLTLTSIWLTTTVVTWLLTPAVIKLYRHFGWDKPHRGYRQSVKDTHHNLVPRGGGLAIFGGLLVGAAIFLAWDQTIMAIILASLLLAVTGMCDDIYDISPWVRLIVNILTAVLMVMVGVRIDFVTNPFGGVLLLTQWSWLPIGLTIIYIVALTNITNWAKGIDGQMPGMVAIAATWIGILALRLTASLNVTAMLSLIVAGCFTGFLWWNFYPQKIMPGYGGGSLAGFLLAVISILAGAKIATLFMVLALPIADAIFTILRRMIAGKSVFLGDRGHLHHKLLDRLHWGRRRIAIFYWLVTLVMGAAALVLPTWGKIGAFLLVVAMVFWFLIEVKLQSLADKKEK
ncbi:undecaprenyl/decaprenyl-phosphate alpha-N-acetylglucosaminyl 1-phosphate transferase [bacterium]|nr:undecaprenyl/decaprenyl-phosphate alpha-N-acetylglucosaminyl 1-phosphate transferase [bacterium]